MPSQTTIQIRVRSVKTAQKDLQIIRYEFRSAASGFLSGTDQATASNQHFHIQIMKPADGRPAFRTVLLLHGFNEKKWDKYIPWGEAICRHTGNAVLFFPLAFHMQRAPQKWSLAHDMYQLSLERKLEYPGIQASSLSNAAISQRLQEKPQRLLLSGLESYTDLIQLITEIRKGKLKELRPDSGFDFFGYSIGGLLAEILKISNPDGIFSDSRVCLFCSGPVFRRLSPVSRHILDSEANRQVQAFLLEELDGYFQQNRGCQVFASRYPSGEKAFRSMLDYPFFPAYREKCLRRYSSQILALALRNDRVIPYHEVKHTLQGSRGNIETCVEALDFSFPCSHENPFPSHQSYQEEVNEARRKVFERVGEFLSN